MQGITWPPSRSWSRARGPQGPGSRRATEKFPRGRVDFKNEHPYNIFLDPELLQVSSPTPSYALRFISGKYQGGEFPLRMDREITIGRASELDMVLIEDMVSRRHAKINTSDGQVTIS